MVVWEITLGTAYFLGLRRTYRLALKAQRNLISPNYPKIRTFLYGRTRGVFDTAVDVHKKIQKTDIEAGRNLGNWILRWLDDMKPAAEIRVKRSISIESNSKSTVGQLINSQKQKLSNNFGKFDIRSLKQNSNRNPFSASRNIWPRSFPTIAMMMRPVNPVGTIFQKRQYSNHTSGALTSYYGRFGKRVMRANINQWVKK